jgi:hypothetical protein
VSRITRGARLALLLAAVGVGAEAATAAVHHGSQEPIVDKQKICHYEGNGSWVEIEPSVNAIIGENGHAGHPDDIIPPFNYEGGSFPGLNWPSGQATWENGCVKPPPEPPKPQPIDVFVSCTATNGSTYDVSFGYDSANTADVTIPIGGANGFAPEPVDRGQPELFTTV